MRVVILGGTGNVGTALLRALRATHPDWQVLGVARRPPVTAADAAVEPYDMASWTSADIASASSAYPLHQLMVGADAVVNLAWAIQPGRHEQVLARTNIDGTARALAAARQAGAAQVIQASSVGAYGPVAEPASDEAAKPTADEHWPTTGIATSGYSRHKVAVERLLDAAEAAGGPVITRLRPGLVLQGSAGAEIGRYFLGPWARALGLVRALPVLPVPASMIASAVHADDLAAGIVALIERRSPGAFNFAATDALTPARIADAFDARRLPLPFAVLRATVALSWRAHLQPTDEGWLDLARCLPLLDTTKARTELGWEPTRTVEDALTELVRAMAQGQGTAAPVLAPR